jgi:hypothetical protein
MKTLFVWAQLSITVCACQCAVEVVGVRGFEPRISASQAQRVARLRYTPIDAGMLDSNQPSTLSSERRSTVKQGLTPQCAEPNRRSVMPASLWSSPCRRLLRAYQNLGSNPVVLTLPSVLATTPIPAHTILAVQHGTRNTLPGSGISESSVQHDGGLPQNP